MSSSGRRISPIAPLTILVEQTLTVAHIVSSPLWTVDPAERSADAAASLDALDFDVAGLDGESITHFVTRDQLLDAPPDGVAADTATPILASLCIEKSLPLGHLFETLAAEDYVFVLDNDEIRYVVTRADLQAPAVGVVVLAYLTVIESGLKALALAELGDAFLDGISTDRRRAAAELFEKKWKQNIAVGMEDCLYLTDWLNIVGSSESLRYRLGYASAHAYDKDTGCFGELRNDLAHGGSILDRGDPRRGLDRVRRVRDFAEAVWEAIEHSDPLWDSYAESVIEFTDTNGKPIGSVNAVSLSGAGPFHVMTAWNPGSRQRSREVNQAANAKLRELLTSEGFDTLDVSGASADGQWREESLLVSGLTRERACGLGSLFGQVAIFELQDDQVRVIRCDDGSEMRSVPVA